MRHVWLTAKYEMRTTLGRRSFWLTTFLLPAAFLLLLLVAEVFSPGGQDQGTATPGVDTRAEPIGYVDPTGLLRTLPTDLPPGIAQKLRGRVWRPKRPLLALRSTATTSSRMTTSHRAG